MKTFGRTALGALVVALVATTLAACGSSSSTKSSSSSSPAAAASVTGSSASRAKLRACLKQHGVTLPNRTGGGHLGGGGYGGGGYPGGGYGGGGYGGGTPPAGGGPGAGTGPGVGGRHRGLFGANGAQAKKLQAAFQACGASFGGRGRFGAGAGGGGFRPTTAALAKFTACVAQHGYKLPKANTSGNGPIFPRAIESNQKFEAAAKACESDLRPTGGRGVGGLA